MAVPSGVPAVADACGMTIPPDVFIGIGMGMGMGIAIPAGAAIIIMHGSIWLGLRGFGAIIIMGIMAGNALGIT